MSFTFFNKIYKYLMELSNHLSWYVQFANVLQFCQRKTKCCRKLALCSETRWQSALPASLDDSLWKPPKVMNIQKAELLEIITSNVFRWLVYPCSSRFDMYGSRLIGRRLTTSLWLLSGFGIIVTVILRQFGGTWIVWNRH